ncbi:monocarboxylate transporter 13-like [Anolis carolinensis]|uniref:monocarboxylate transporter 13-like n=1 Tax=Anolis carolinensis TaxID=28377 RepID=UPI002F2B278E
MSPRVFSKPPDGGWGWMVVLAAFCQSALVFGVVRSFGVFFVEFVAHFQESSSSTSWITSVCIATLMCGSPLATGLGKRFGERPVAMLGGFLSGFGLLLASIATSLAQLYLFIGLLTGVGGALIFAPSLSLVARYFDRRRAVANAVAFSGAGIAALGFSPLFQLLVDSYGWRGGLQIVSGMVFNLVVCGALLRPLRLATEETKASPEVPGRGRRLVLLFGLDLLLHRDFLIFSGAGMLITCGYFIPFAHLVPHAREMGLDEYQAAFLVSAVGVSDIVGRVLAGGLAGWTSLRLVHSLAIWTVLTGLSLLAVPLGRSYVAMMAISVAYGFLASAVIPLKFSSLVEIVGTEQLMGAIGLIHMLESLEALVGPPLSGWIRDWTGSYNASFLAGGAFVTGGGLVLLMLPGFFSFRPPASPKKLSRRTEVGEVAGSEPTE